MTAPVLAATAECPDELVSQHHLGAAGPGVLLDDEVVVLALFKPAPDGYLTDEHFPTKDLKRTEVSVARRSHTDRPTFDAHVVRGGAGPNGPLLGVACAVTNQLRKLLSTINAGGVTTTFRSVCILDKAEPADYDGHAALGYSEAQDGLTEQQKRQVRETIRRNLITTFGAVCELDQVLPLSTTPPSLP